MPGVCLCSFHIRRVRRVAIESLSSRECIIASLAPLAIQEPRWWRQLVGSPWPAVGGHLHYDPRPRLHVRPNCRTRSRPWARLQVVGDAPWPRSSRWCLRGCIKQRRAPRFESSGCTTMTSSFTVWSSHPNKRCVGPGEEVLHTSVLLLLFFMFVRPFRRWASQDAVHTPLEPCFMLFSLLHTQYLSP